MTPRRTVCRTCGQGFGTVQGAKSSLGRIIYAVATATAAAALIGIQSIEFGIKVAILSSLLVTCALVPLIEMVSRRIQDRKSGAPVTPRPASGSPARRLLGAVRNPIIVAVLVIAVAAPLNTVLGGSRQNVLIIERGLTPHHVQ